MRGQRHAPAALYPRERPGTIVQEAVEQRVLQNSEGACMYVINMLGFMPGCQVSLLTKQLIYSKIVLTVFCLLLQQYRYLMTCRLFRKHAVLHKLFVTLTHYLHRRPNMNSLKRTMLGEM